MTFPIKKNNQTLKGFVRQVLSLIEHEHRFGMPMTAIHTMLNKEAGFSSSYKAFSNTLSKVRKEEKAAGLETKILAAVSVPATTQKSPPPAARSFVWNSAKGAETLDEIYGKKR